MKRIAIISLSIIGLLIAAAVIVPFFIPTSVYKTQIETAAENALGREVVLQGDPKLSILPSISARIDGATISNPDGFSDPLMIEAGELSAKVKVLPLFSGRVEVAEIGLSDATVRLEKRSDGQNNWTFEPVNPEDEEDAAENESGSLNAGIDRARLKNASIFFTDNQTGTQYALEGFDGTARMTAFDKPFSSSGNGKLNGQAFDYDLSLASIETLQTGAESTLDLDLKTDFGNIGFDGALTLLEETSIDGDFDVKSTTIGALIQFLGADLPIMGSDLQSIVARGQVSGAMPSPALTFSKLEIGATGLDLDYTGSVALSDPITLNGALKVAADRPNRIFKPEIEGLESLALLENFKLEGSVNGPVTGLSLTGLSVRQDSDLIDLSFDGNLALAPSGTSDGQLDLSSQNLRGLLAALNVDMTEGDTLQSFSLKGDVSGSDQSLRLSNTNFKLDDMTASGTFGADLSGARPKIIGDIAMPSLDISPFLGEGGEQTNAAPSQDWSDDPLALDGLSAIDADIKVSADTVTFGKITLTDALLDTKLTNGNLTAAFARDNEAPGFRVFGGDWSGNINLNASRSTPTLAFKANADEIITQQMLTALAGYAGLSGLGDISIDLQSSGNSLKALVNGLDGSMNSNVADGQLAGINLAQMVRSASNLQGLIGSGGLTVDAFQDAISPEAETDFSSLISGLSFNNGVATIQSLDLSNPVVSVIGSGQIDLGARTIDIRLVPAIDTSATGQGSSLSIEDIPIPVRISGAWTSPQFGLDTAAVQQELTSRLTQSVENRARDEISNILGNALGRDGEAAPNEDETDDASDSDAPEEEQSLEDQLIDDALGSIFGRGD